jgi:hypothetical protein
VSTLDPSDIASGDTIASAPAPASPARSLRLPRRDLTRLVGVALACFIVCLIAYVVLAVPGSWFPRAADRSWDANSLTLVRGTGTTEGGAVIVTGTDAGGIALVTATTDFRSSDYPGIAWNVAGLAETADVELLWRTDAHPDKINSRRIAVQNGRLLPLVVAGDSAWFGRITGLALAIRAPLAQPVRVFGVTAKPMGIPETIRDRLHDWFEFETWTGTSINTIVGGNDNQPLPLPAVLVIVLGISAVAIGLLRRLRPQSLRIAVPAVLAIYFVAGWFALDARWTWNLIRQEGATNARYGGKDTRDKHLASEDADLFAFIDKARPILPATPARIFIAADADYFRGRAAYHLYPHRVYADPQSDALPAASVFRPGDWLLVYHRRGLQYDRAHGRIRFEDGQTIDADVKLVEPGAALFRIR